MVPRHEWNCKETEKLHRPRLHVVGAIVAGVLEAYFICEEGMASDSNLQCTILSRLLDLVHNFLAKAGLGVPHHVIFHADNTNREHQNSWVLAWQCKLLVDKVFGSVTNCYLQVGHTHMGLDARFAVIATALGRMKLLETPEDLPRYVVYNSPI